MSEAPGGDARDDRYGERAIDAALRLGAETGRIVLESGGETYRAEDSVVAVAGALGALDPESFAMPTGLMCSAVDERGENRAVIRRIRRRQMNLERLARTHAFVRQVVSGAVDRDGAERSICDIETIGSFRQPLPVLGSAAIAGFFCALFGGSWNEALAAACVGALLGRLTALLGSLKLPDFVVNISGGFFTALAADAIRVCGLVSRADTLVIGTIMLLVPGVMIVNAIRDTIAGDLVAGVSRGAEAFISAAGISIGVGVAIKLWALGGLP